MSVSATAAASAASSIINLRLHNHKKAPHLDSTAASGTTTSGQAPATTQGLFSSLLKTIEQVAGVSPLASAAVAAVKAVTTSVPGAASATGTTTAGTALAAGGPDAGAASQTQNVQGFVHSLFQALKADGLGGGANDEVVAGATGTAPAGTAGQYEGRLVSSLQTLIQQVQAGGAATPATAGLAASYDTLVQGAGGSTASAGGPSSPPSLANFLSDLLQTAQNNGGHALSALGATVNTTV